MEGKEERTKETNDADPFSQDEPFETPMQPITAMRNALGREEGGSGVPLNRAEYLKSVAYWQEKAPVV